MNKVIGFDEDYGVLSAQAGVTLYDAQSKARDFNHEFPCDIGAKRNCQIGGNLATNVGSINYVKHGSMHANCVGMKAVLPSGEILDNMTTLRKDNTGYDLKQLMIGAEGTLGVITECAIKCGPKPLNKNVMLLALRNFDDCRTVIKKARHELGDIIRSLQFMDGKSVEIVTELTNHAKYPFHKAAFYFLLIEVDSLQ